MLIYKLTKLKYFSLASKQAVFFICHLHLSAKMLSIFCFCSVVGGVGLSPWGLENGHFLGLIRDWGFLNLDEGLGGGPGSGGGGLGGGWGDVTGGLVWSSGSWVGVVVWHGLWLLLGAWGSSWTIHGAVSSAANLSGAVNTIRSVVSVAGWEWAGRLNDNWGPLGHALLVVVEWLTLHDDILTEVLITVHAGGEELLVWWGAGDTSNTGVNAGADLEEATSGWHSLVPGWLVEVWWGIAHSDSGGASEEKSNNGGLHCFKLIVFINYFCNGANEKINDFIIFYSNIINIF